MTAEITPSKMARRSVILLGAALLALSAACALGAGVATQLTADVMDYDVETGDFKAQGNVTLKREGLTLTSVHGHANTQTQKARVWDNVRAFGIYNGEKLDATCAQLDADLAVPGGDFLMTGSVDASFGTRVLRSDTARLVGQTFSADNVKHFEDTSRSIVLRCEKLDGDYDSQGLRRADGRGSVNATQEDKDKNSELWCDAFNYNREANTLTGNGSARILVTQKTANAKVTDIRGDTLVYAFDKGTVTAEGNARAVQDGRRVSARKLVYYPDTGKLEAIGRPSITVDIDASGALRAPQKRQSRARTRKGGQ